MGKTELLKEVGFEEEVAEEVKDQFLPTGFPKPIKRYRITWERPNLSVEESYFWCLNYIGKDISFPHVYKTIDVFSAAENSAFFGVSQQRIGLQQDKVSQFLATVGKMIKEVFQLVRELRILDERMGYYTESFAGKESAEITLKGIWIDMVEGGAKNPSSVFGMAREVQFTSLPDLFFSTHPKTSAEVDEFVDRERAGFNKSVRNALKRKLKMFMIWKENTFNELVFRKNFTLKYLKQHYEIMRMYLTWVKPYLRHIRRLTLDDEKVLSPDMVSAFEGSMIEIEFLAHKEPMGKYHACILAHFLFRTRASMSFQQEGYQRGPLHVGKIDINIRAYVWTKEQIEKFKEYRNKEDLDLLRSVSDSVAAAIDASGGELQSYLKEAEGAKEEAAKPSKPTAAQRLRAEFLGPPKPKKPKIKRPKVNPVKDKADMKKAAGVAKESLFVTFKNFKKGHGLVMW